MKCFYFFDTNDGNEKEKSSGPASNGQTIKCSGLLPSPRSISDIYEGRAGNLRVFELNELKLATNDFSRLLKIGQGGFGSVYEGRLVPGHGKNEKTPVAIKKLKQNSLQGHKQWLTEVQFLGVVEHPNLVKLIGYCAVDGERAIQRLLVYEYMPNKSLNEHLFNKAYPTLSWNSRLQIALGAAKGLYYLHEGLETQVIHRDFKASNVLLDKKFNPKLSDFGLATEGPSGDRTHVTTEVVGTRGYAAPEYIETGHLTTKSDVWSFGVVLFEMITGRRSLERNRPRGEQMLLEWVEQYPVESERFHMIIDPRLNEFSLAAARMTAKLANQCLLKDPKQRPTMHEVVSSLKQAIEVTET